MSFRVSAIATLCVFSFWSVAVEARAEPATSEHWVATWATAQQLVPVMQIPMPGGQGTAPIMPGAAPNAPAQNATPVPNAPGRGRGGPGLPRTFADQTIRMIVHTSLGGRRVRVELSNMFGAKALQVGAAHIAVHKGGGAIADGTDRALTFAGRSSFVVQPGVLVMSDPVELEFAPLSDLAVSLYLPEDTGTPTAHNLGLHTSYISKGDVSGAANVPESTTTTAYFWLSSVDVIATADAFALATLGDSITDGARTTVDANAAWPAVLAKRLSANKATQHVAVINQGIAGNQVLRDSNALAGVSALARLDRDILSRPGVKWVVLLEGINDINLHGRPDIDDQLKAEDLIWAYREIIARCHQHGIRVIGATVMPDQGVNLASDRGEGIRQTVNAWIRAKGSFDGVVDFDAVSRDPQNPAHIRAEFDPGDHIHQNDAGNKAMAEAFDLRLFKN